MKGMVLVFLFVFFYFFPTGLKIVKLSGKKRPIWQHCLHVLALLPQRKSMRPTENEADMEHFCQRITCVLRVKKTLVTKLLKHTHHICIRS